MRSFLVSGFLLVLAAAACGSEPAGTNESALDLTQPKPKARAEEGALATFDGNAVEAIVADDSSLYFAVEGKLLSLPKSGGEARTLFTSALGYSTESLAVDDQYVYFALGRDVSRVAKASGEVEVLASNILLPGSFGLDDTHLYFVRGGSDSPAPNGDVVRMPKGGGAFEVLAANEPCPATTTLFENDVYFFSGGTGGGPRVRRVAKTGGAVTTVLDGEWEAGRFVIADRALFYTSDSQGGTLQRFDLAGGTPRTVAALERRVLGTNGKALFSASLPEASTSASVLRIDPAAGQKDVLGRWSYEAPNPPVIYPGSGHKTPATAFVADATRVYWADIQTDTMEQGRVSIRSAPLAL